MQLANFVFTGIYTCNDSLINVVNLGDIVLKISSISSKISFGENPPVNAEAKTSVTPPSEGDSITLENKIEPPHISTLDLFLGKITDEQIAQINKAKMLPKNAKFNEVLIFGGRGGLLTEPFYEITWSVLPTNSKNNRILPKGYEVVRNAQNSPMVGAVKIKAK